MTETEYVTQFEKIFQTYDRTERYLDLSDNFKSYVDDKRSWIDRLESAEFPVAFLGHFNTGKSTMINAILGKNILPEAIRAYTAIPTLLKKGEKDCVIIHYLGDTERRELRNLYVEEISKELRKSSKGYLELNNRELLSKLDQEISEAVNTSQAAFSKGKSFKELKSLIKNWDKLNGETKEIRLSELPNYVTEDYEDVLLVDKAEVHLAEIKMMPAGVVLVDLPGLGVVNPRHKKITKDYVREKAKAFVIVSAVFKLLEGEEAILLDEVNKQRSSVLQRAFWVINKWDTLNSTQKTEEDNNFKDKMKQYSFQYTPDRVFKVTALYYLLLKLIEYGELDNSGKIKAHVEGLKKFVETIPQSPDEAETCLKQKEETRDFFQFQRSLFAYLQTTAKQEFLDEARHECLELSTKLCDTLEPLYMEIDEHTKEFQIKREITKRAKQVLHNIRENVIEGKIVEILKTIDASPEKVAWTEEEQAEFKKQVEDLIKSLVVTDLKLELKTTTDGDIIWSHLPKNVDQKLPIAKLFRQQFLALMEKNVVNTFSQELLRNLSSNPLPEDVLKVLRDKLSSRDLLSRLKGLCDLFLFEYGEMLDKCGAEVSVPSFREKKTDDIEVIKAALELYEQNIIDFFTGLDINRRIQRSVENYFKEMRTELSEMFADKEGKIESDIGDLIKDKVTSDIEKDLTSEKQVVINDSYRTLMELKSSCQG